MRPRTKFQQNVVAASKHLPPLTPAQIEWGYKNCIEHIGRRTPKGLITCTECGHTWQSENGELTDNLLGCECPHCHTTLKVETTLRRKFNDYEYLCIATRCKGFQVLRFVYIECWAKVGQTPVYTHIEAVQRWIAPEGRSATFARLRPMGFFVHGWSWSSALELRTENDGKYNITPTRIYPRQRLIPELRRSGYGKQLPDVTPFDLIHLLLSENKAETLLKAGQTALVRFFARSSRNIADYWPAIRIAIRNGDAIGKPTEWCGRSMVQFSCKCACTRHLWDSRKQRLVGKSAEAVSVNKELDRLQVSIHQVYESLSGKLGNTVTAGQVRELVFGLNSESQGLLHFLDEYIDHFRDRVGIDRSERRLKCLLLFRRHLSEFIRYRYHVDDIPVQKADTALIKDLEDYFAKEKGFKLNTSAGYLTMLASLLKDLHKRHIIDTYPFIGHSIRWDVGTPRYITREDVNRIAALSNNELQGYEQVSRDMFLFSCYTGLSYTDVYHLTAEHIIHESDMDWIRKPRVKTGNICYIPLLPEASAIIERYRGIHTRAFRHEPPKGYLLPIPGCDTVNVHLKKIARLCGITKKLTFHMARHTFASQMTLSEGVSIESVSKMLGHSQIKTTQVYAETSPERVFRDVEKILPFITQYHLTN